MSPTIMKTLVETLGFPRVSGDEPSLGTLTGMIAEFSPRERG